MCEMKKSNKDLTSCLKNNLRAIVESVILVLSIVFPLFLDTKSMFKNYLAKNEMSPDNFVLYFAVKHGGVIASIVLFVITLYLVLHGKLWD